MSTYPIFENKKKQTLVFYACAKNANSSAKLFFAKHLGIENKFFFIEDKIPKYKTKESLNLIKNYDGKKNLINIWPNHQKFEKVKSNFKCCIIRNPHERFISAYKNRVLFHKDKKFNNYTIDMILNELEKNNFHNKHFLPQSYYLGYDLSYYSLSVDLKKINLFTNYINDFFEKKIEFPKLQTGGQHFNIELSTIQKTRIEKIYQKDFEFF